MTNKGIGSERNEKFIQLLDSYLKKDAAQSSPPESGHLDGDMLSAFIEGNIKEKESLPITAHLIECSFCLHKSAELIKLQMEFGDEPAPALIPDSAPTKVSEVLSGILSKVFGGSEAAVFAHQEEEPEGDDESKEEE